ncbi:hypothetical protein PHYSODRAFT_436383, partial [Phytophthora sojae]
LADLALDSIGLRTGRVSTRSSAVQSPLQADVFTHSQAYALLLLGDASAGALDAVSAAFNGAAAFHAVYPSQAASVKVPAAVAQEFQAKHHAGVRCAGSAALCASVEADAPSVAAELVQEVLKANSFLDAADAADVAFARELAQVAQLSAQLKQQTEQSGKTLYVVGVSGLQGDKQKRAQQAVATTVAEFLAQLMKKSGAAAAQVMTGKLPAATQQVAALSRRARNRKLVSGLTNEDEEEEEEEEESDSASASDSDSDDSDSEESDEDEDEEVVDLSARSGSVWDEVGDDNSTSKTNTTAAGAVSMPDIAEFQIILWTSVLLGSMLLMAVLAMGNMDTGRDSLLYAKFIADVNGRKTN